MNKLNYIVFQILDFSSFIIIHFPDSQTELGLISLDSLGNAVEIHIVYKKSKLETVWLS